MVRRITVVDAGEIGCRSVDREFDFVVRIRANIPVLIEKRHLDEGEVLPVGRDLRPVRREGYFRGRSGRADHIGRDHLTAFCGDGLKLARLVGHAPGQMDAGNMWNLVRMGCTLFNRLAVGSGRRVALGIDVVIHKLIVLRQMFYSERASIQKELDRVGVAVNRDRNRFPLESRPGPVREDVHHGLAAPLALVHVVPVLGKTAEIARTEFRTPCRPEAIGRRFAQIVESGPDELARHPGSLLQSDLFGFGI